MLRSSRRLSPLNSKCRLESASDHSEFSQEAVIYRIRKSCEDGIVQFVSLVCGAAIATFLSTAYPAIAESVATTQTGSTGGTQEQIAVPTKDAEHQFLDEVLNTVEEHFLDLNNQNGVADSSRTKIFNGLSWPEIRLDLDQTKLESREDTYAAVRKLLKRLGDRYTRFMPPKEFATLTKYDVTGVGILLAEREGKIYLAAPPLAGSTGAEAGLRKVRAAARSRTAAATLPADRLQQHARGGASAGARAAAPSAAARAAAIRCAGPRPRRSSREREERETETETETVR